MTLLSPNPSPRLPAALLPLLTSAEDRYVMVDVGSRDGALDVMRWFKGMGRVIGFDVDADECARLNALHPGGEERSYPYAIAEKEEKRTFYMTRNPYSSGLHRGNSAWLSRFPWRNLDIVGEAVVMTTSLDAFADQEGVDHIDFIKIDVEGAELEVLHGASRSLADRAVLGIKTELWWDSEIKGQPPFAKLDTFIREAGFRFFDLALHRYERNTLPAGRLEGTLQADKTTITLNYVAGAFGQAATGDALYFRDPVGDRREGRKTLAWSDQQLLRLCGLFDVYDYGDCAIEVLEEFREQLSKKYDVDALIEAVTPSVAGRVPQYAAYLEWSNTIRRQVNETRFRDADWQPRPRPHSKTK
jgi:FkbM family methyltransferase